MARGATDEVVVGEPERRPADDEGCGLQDGPVHERWSRQGLKGFQRYATQAKCAATIARLIATFMLDPVPLMGTCT